jgi:hypothetical protein
MLKFRKIEPENRALNAPKVLPPRWNNGRLCPNCRANLALVGARHRCVARTAAASPNATAASPNKARTSPNKQAN